MKLNREEILLLIKEELDSFEVKQEGHKGEGSMARSDLYKLRNYCDELMDMIDDQTDLDEWVESKITKAADYIGTVKHYLEAGTARMTGALEEAIEREKLLKLAMGVLNRMQDSELEEFINDSEDANNTNESLQISKKKDNIIDEKLLDKIRQALMKKGNSMPTLKAPQMPKDRKAINIVPRPGQTDSELRAKADSDTPYQTAGKDVDLPTIKDKLKKSARMKASLAAKSKKQSARVTVAMNDFKDRLARADTMEMVMKAEDILNAELSNIKTDETPPPDMK